MARQERDAATLERLADQLLVWYEINRRDLPWRHTRDPYAIWVSEVMLQQTRVAVVGERYRAFLQRFPTLQDLAAAPEQDVLALWSGLGYYRRARMLQKAAQFVVSHHAGCMPTTAAELRLLPGIGAYTAAAIASIAHGEPVAVVDGNVERVLCRMQGWSAASRSRATTQRRRVESLADKLLVPGRPGDSNQAMMELGALICTPRNPKCMLCPLTRDCKTRGEHKTQPRPRMRSQAIACALVVRTTGDAGQQVREVFLEQRPATESVMPGLWQLPMLREAAMPEEDVRLTVRHAIMQVNYYVRVREVAQNQVDTLAVAAGERRWVPLVEAAAMALTGLTRKVLTRAHLLRHLPPGSIAAESTARVS